MDSNEGYFFKSANQPSLGRQEAAFEIFLEKRTSYSERFELEEQGEIKFAYLAEVASVMENCEILGLMVGWALMTTKAAQARCWKTG